MNCHTELDSKQKHIHHRTKLYLRKMHKSPSKLQFKTAQQNQSLAIDIAIFPDKQNQIRDKIICHHKQNHIPHGALTSPSSDYRKPYILKNKIILNKIILTAKQIRIPNQIQHPPKSNFRQMHKNAKQKTRFKTAALSSNNQIDQGAIFTITN